VRGGPLSLWLAVSRGASVPAPACQCDPPSRCPPPLCGGGLGTPLPASPNPVRHLDIFVSRLRRPSFPLCVNKAHPPPRLTGGAALDGGGRGGVTPAPPAPSPAPSAGKVLFGTQLGASRRLAARLVASAAARGVALHAVDLGAYDPDALASEAGPLLILLSTAADGHPPEVGGSGAPLFML